MKKVLFTLAAVALLAGCSSTKQCVPPDPLVPAYSNDSTLKPAAK